MEMIQPWNTSIMRIDVSSSIDIDRFSAELICELGVDLDGVGNLNETDNQYLKDIHDTVIFPHICKYMADIFRLPESEFLIHVGSFARLITDGSALEPHTHCNGVLTAVLYLSDANAELVLVDPRIFSQRGVPVEVSKRLSKNLSIVPKAGELWIFPSFIQHYVRAALPEFRLSFISDFDYDRYTKESDTV